MRTIVFPDRDVGRIMALGDDGFVGREIAIARGEVAVDERVVLQLAAETDLALLRDLPPRAIDGLQLRHCDDPRQLEHAQHLDLTAFIAPYALRGGAALEHVRPHRRLEHLDITAAWGIDAHAEILGGFPALRTLGLYETSFSDEHVVHIPRKQRLERLDVGYTHVTDVGLARMPEWPRLRWLILTHLPITDASVASLASRTSLEKLSLGNTKLSPEGFFVLRAALPRCDVHGP